MPDCVKGLFDVYVGCKCFPLLAAQVVNCFLKDECSVHTTGLGPETPLEWVDF